MAYNYGNFQYQPQPMYTTNQIVRQPVAMNEASNPYGQYQTTQPGNTGFVWVQGEAGAKAYPVAPGNSVLLMDSENPVLYMKTTDSTGRPLPMETYDLVKREPAPIVPQAAPQVQQVDLSQYVKLSDLEQLVKKLMAKELGE